jgi:predicted nucleotidyltransferase
VDAVFTANDYTETLFKIYNSSVHNGVKIINQKVVGRISATAIRQKIIKADAAWEKMVPSAAVQFLKKNKLDERIRILSDSAIG